MAKSRWQMNRLPSDLTRHSSPKRAAGRPPRRHSGALLRPAPRCSEVRSPAPPRRDDSLWAARTVSPSSTTKAVGEALGVVRSGIGPHQAKTLGGLSAEEVNLFQDRLLRRVRAVVLVGRIAGPVAGRVERLARQQALRRNVFGQAPNKRCAASYRDPLAWRPPPVPPGARRRRGGGRGRENARVELLRGCRDLVGECGGK